MKKRRKSSRLSQIGAFLLAATLLIGLCPPGVQIRNMKVTVPKVKAAESISNPRIVEDSSMEAGQKVTWDCIWFGSYPQSEVTSTDSVYNTLKRATDWDSNNDITVNGTKYRRLKGEDATYYETDPSEKAGMYDWEDNYNEYHYFKYEPIKWRVLYKENGEAFLLSDTALDDQKYNVNDTDITWENCSIRSWLNGYGTSINEPQIDYTSNNFINSAFSQEEKDAIKKTNVVNNDNISYDTAGGNETVDKIFLLSESEIYDGSLVDKYGFTSNKFNADEAKRSHCSVYASAMGTYQESDFCEYTDNASWLLRSPGQFSDFACYIDQYGSVEYNGSNVDDKMYGVRPALYLDLSASEFYSYAGTVCSDGSSDEVENKQNHQLNVQFGKDNFSFINERKSFPLSKNDRYEMDTSIIDNSSFNETDKYAMKKELDGFGGACYGMSSLTFQLFKKKINIKTLQNNAKCPFDLNSPKSNKTMSNFIGFYQTAVKSSTYQNAKSDFINKSQKEMMEFLISKLKRIEKEKNPILIDYGWISEISSKEADAAHAVLAYGIENVDAPYRWEGVDYEYKIKVINPNILYTNTVTSEDIDKSCIYITKNMDKCYIPISGIRSDTETEYSLQTGNPDDIFLGKMQLQFVTNDEKFLPAQYSAKKVKYDSIYSNENTVKIDGKTITGFQGVVAGVYGKSIVPSGSGSGLQIFIDKKPHKIEVLDNTQEFDMSHQDTLQSVSASKGSSITLDNNKISLDNKKDSFEITFVSNKKIPNTNKNILHIQGNGKKEVQVELAGEGLKVKGDNLSNVNVVTEGGEKVKIPYSGDVIIKEKGNAIVVEKEKIKVNKINLTGISRRIAAGKKITLKASVLPANATNKKLTWKSSNTKVATVSQRGVVTLKKNSGGKKVTITATAQDGSKKFASWKITSMKGIVKSVKVSGKTQVKAGKSITLKAKVSATKKANAKLKWSSSNTKVATISQKGVVKANKKAKGKTVKITAMATDGSNKKATIKIKIK